MNEDTFIRYIDSLNFQTFRDSISGLMRALGLGPDADRLALIIIVAFIIFAMIGYASGDRRRRESGKHGAAVERSENVSNERKDKTQ